MEWPVTPQRVPSARGRWHNARSASAHRQDSDGSPGKNVADVQPPSRAGRYRQTPGLRRAEDALVEALAVQPRIEAYDEEAGTPTGKQWTGRSPCCCRSRRCRKRQAACLPRRRRRQHRNLADHRRFDRIFMLHSPAARRRHSPHCTNLSGNLCDSPASAVKFFPAASLSGIRHDDAAHKEVDLLGLRSDRARQAAHIQLRAVAQAELIAWSWPK